MLWAPPAGTKVLGPAEGGLGPLDDGTRRVYLLDAIALLGVLLEPA